MQTNKPQADISSGKYKFLGLILLGSIFLVIGKFVAFDAETFKTYFAGLPIAFSGLIFIVLYVFLTFFIWLGPKDILRIAAAFVYGAVLSTVLIMISEMINVVLLFSLSRRLGRDFVKAKLKGRMRRMDEAIADTSFASIFFIRFLPFVPLRFLDLGFGLTKISLKKYFAICLLATPIRIYIVQLLLAIGLDTVMNPQRFQAYLDQHPNIFLFCSVYFFGSLAMLFVLKFRAKRSR